MKTLASVLALALPLFAQDPAPAPGAGMGVMRQATLVDGGTVELRVRVSEPKRTVLSAVTFPAPIRSLVSAWNEKDLSVEQAGNRLFLKLLSPAQGHLDVLLEGDRLVRLYLMPVKDDVPYDAAFQIILPVSGEKTEPRAERGSGALAHARAMRLGEIPPGVTVRKADGVLILETPNVEASLSWVYDAAQFRGYVVRLANGSRMTGYEIDLPRFHAEDLVLAGARNLVIEPRSFTYLYLVFWKR
jgi:hypothetical protein